MELFGCTRSFVVRAAPALLLLGAAPASAQGIRLNAPLTRLSIDGEVRELALSADGEWLVYMNVLDIAVSNEARLFSLRRGAPQPTLVTDALRRFSDFAITPDSAQIVYQTSFQPGLTPGLYRVPIDASGPPVQISPVYGPFAFDPAGTRVVFWDSFAGVSVAPLDGSAAPLLLSSLSAWFTQISPDGTRAVFIGTTAGVSELYSVPLDGSAGAVRLSAPMVANGDVLEFALTADGTRAVYRADQDLDLADELYSVPLDGSAPPVKLNSPLGLRTQDVTAFRLSASGEYVVYRSDETAQGVFELFSVPVDAGASPLELAGPLVAGGDVGTAFEIHGARVVYLADSRFDDVVELHQVDILRRFGPRRLSGDLVAGGDVVQFWIEKSGERVVYRADQATDETFGLWSERLRHPAGPVSLAAESGPEVALGGGRAVFRLVPHLFSVPTAGGAAPVQLDPPLPLSGYVRPEFEIEPGNAGVLFRADATVEGMVELWRAPIAGGAPAVSISAPVGGDELAGRIVSAKISADSSRVLFIESVAIDSSDSERDVLFSRALAPSARPVELYSGPSNADDIAITHLTGTGARVLFTTGSEEGESFQNLFSVPADGTLPAVQLNAPTNNEEGVGSVATTPDGVTAVWSEDGGARGIWAARADGSTTPRLLSTPGTVGPPSRFELTPQGAGVVYLEPLSTGNSARLFTVPVNGATPPLPLNTVTAPRGSNTSFRITPDGARVVYRTDENTDEVYELLVVRIDGVGGPTALSSTLVPNGDVESFQLDATAFRAVFASDRLADGELELFSVLTDGTALPVPLVDLPDASRRTYEYAIAPNGACVVFRADLAAPGVVELWSVPIDGSAAPTRLNGPLVAGGDVQGNFLSSPGAFAISPDGARVVYSADERTDDVRELFGVPIDGSTPRVRLSGPFVAGGSLSGSFAITSDSRRVVYVADQEVDDRFELFAAPLRRPRASVKLSAPLVAEGDVEAHSFVVTPDATAVLYVADQEEDTARELFMSFLAGPLNQHRPR